MSIEVSTFSEKQKKEKITISLPKTLLVDLHRYILPRKRNQAIVDATMKMIEMLKQQKAVKESAGIWKDEAHSELEEGVDAYVRQIRADWHKRELRLKLEKK